MKALNSPKLCWRSWLVWGWLFALGMAGSASAQDPYAPKPPIPAGYKIVEGDILVPVDFVYPPQKSGHPRKALYLSDVLWPYGVVPYEFDDNVSAANQQAMLDAMQEWEKVANVHFVPLSSTNLVQHIHIRSSTGNTSPIGVKTNGTVNIVNWNQKITMAHELAHTLGFWHEQSREDRDAYIRVETSNIQPDFRDQFDLHSEANHFGPYDFDSLMHYDSCAFSIDCQDGWTCACSNRVITVLPPYDVRWQNAIGQRSHLSYWDRWIMAYLYPQPNWRFADRAADGSGDGTFFRPLASYAEGKAAVPSGGSLFLLRTGTYSTGGVQSKRMTIRAPLGATLRR